MQVQCRIHMVLEVVVMAWGRKGRGVRRMPKGIMSEGWNVDTLVAAGAGISMDSPSRDFCWVMVFIFHALPPAGFLRDQGGVVERWNWS